MRRQLLGAMVAAVIVVSAAPVAAQDDSQDGKATALAVTAGVSRANEATHGVFGGEALFELTAHFALQTAGRWMDRGPHPGAYAAELTALVGLGGTRDTAVPYVAAGIGFHRRTFDGADAASIPEFYRRRLGPDQGPGAISQNRTFTDPTLVVGTGVDVALSRTATVRPDVRALFVLSDGRRDTVVLATVSLGFRFEHKPVTPSRR
ncbi:MAG: outer membrane beta-barrel protein [Acidobacteria bacterium]|nr:outer membrane beta-barrel protein [Acidobacteriota bacterium]